MSTTKEEKALDRKVIERIVGRTIVEAVPNGEWDSDDRGTRHWIHNWHLHLDDGTVLKFVTEETDHGAGYGTDIIVCVDARK